MSAASAAVCVMIRAFEALSFRITVSSFTASKSHGSDTRRPLTAYRPSGVVSGNIWGFRRSLARKHTSYFPEGGDTGLRNERKQAWSFTNRPALLFKAGFNLQAVLPKTSIFAVCWSKSLQQPSDCKEQSWLFTSCWLANTRRAFKTTRVFWISADTQKIHRAAGNPAWWKE